MSYVCITLVVCNTIGKTFLVRGLHKLEFKTCLDSWSVWRLARDSVEQSQNSFVIIGLGQERYVKNQLLRLCLVTVFFFYFQKLVLGNIKKNNFLVFFKSKTCLVS